MGRVRSGAVAAAARAADDDAADDRVAAESQHHVHDPHDVIEVIMVPAGTVSVVHADMSVATKAGAMAVAETPRSDSSALTVSSRDIRAALLAP